MTENAYSLIMAIVNQGFSEEVMNAARPKGASGGTVFHSRRIGNQEAMKFWKISVQEEREVVLILAQKEDKLAIMQEIGRQCGMNSKAQGIVMSLPVDGIAGLD
ncbi:MAG: P-II family nitrogen regulator [Lachnospiraceae bacterium]|nr:P-II family nitrogen regulator [Lachnospiraceae bacterium]